MCVIGFTSDQETRILGNYTVLTDRLVLESSKFVWEGESRVSNLAALFNRQSVQQQQKQQQELIGFTIKGPVYTTPNKF